MDFQNRVGHKFGTAGGHRYERSDARSKCIASSNKCLTSSNKKLLGAPGLTTRSKDATGGSIAHGVL